MREKEWKISPAWSGAVQLGPRALRLLAVVYSVHGEDRMGIKVTCGVFYGRRGYQGVVHGKLGGRTIWSERTGKVRRDIMSALTDAQITAAGMRA